MAEKTTGLAAFTQKKVAPPQGEAQEQRAPMRRRRGLGDTVALSVRVSRPGWERLHQLAVAKGVSIQSLALQGFDRIFAEEGLPGIEQ